MRWLLGLCLALATTVSTPSTAFADPSTTDFQTWSALLGTAQVDPDGKVPLRLWFDGHVRRGSDGTVMIVRPAAGWQVRPWMSLWAGYAWIPVLSEDGGRFDEHRIWQQVILQGRFFDKRVGAQARTRLEQRFFEGAGGDVGHRVRQFVRADHRFGDSPFGAVVWDELFWGLGAAGPATTGFDQNRIFVGGALHAIPGVRIEAGYLDVRLLRNDVLQSQHALALNLFVALKP